MSGTISLDTVDPNDIGGVLPLVCVVGGVQKVINIDPSSVIAISQNDVASLPDGTETNGGVVMTGTASLPSGLTDNGGVVLTDETHFYTTASQNGGVLIAAGE